jgi:hypothetical protein
MKEFEKAFPVKYGVEEGMDLRDYFAAKAMELFISKGKYYVEETAKLAYLQADAMLKEREK